MHTTKHVLWRGRTGNDANYFHPRVTTTEKSGYLIMTLQEISGSDNFGVVQISYSYDNGNSWSKPEIIPALDRVPLEHDIYEGVCDVVPDYHAQTNTVLAIGHNVYYRDDKLYDSLADFGQENGPRLQRYIAYTTMASDGTWNPQRKRLFFEDFNDCSMFSCGCSQKVILPNGQLIIPVTFGFFGRKDRMVSSLKCSYDGSDITVTARGNTLELPEGRGLLEPSITLFNNTYYMTIRAEDDHGYLSTSSDGLSWAPIRQWQWDNGNEINMSTTQQHWLILQNKLYLVYTRKAEHNSDVIRWRSPLFIAQVDTKKQCLMKDTEQTLLPIVGDALNNPKEVPLMGNFHPRALNNETAIVTVGEMIPSLGFKGDTLLARIQT
jgi:hypothetical protein